MGKSRRGQKERSREQELKYENSKLRRDVSSLRKQLARIDLDRHSYVRDIVEEHLAGEEQSIDSTHLLEKMKARWKCHECHEGHMEIFVYSKIGQPWYYRQCSNCPNRTKSQPHHKNVEGIKKEIPQEPEKPGFSSRNKKER